MGSMIAIDAEEVGAKAEMTYAKEIKDSFAAIGPSQARSVTLYKNTMLRILENDHYK